MASIFNINATSGMLSLDAPLVMQTVYETWNHCS